MEEFEGVIIGIIISAIAFFTVYLVTPIWIKWLEKHNIVVNDRHRKGGAKVTRPGGPILILGILASEITLYAFLGANEILAVIFTTTLAFIIGIIDDWKVMTGWFKPLALAGSSIPIIILGTFDPNLLFPLFGEIKIPILYLAVIPLMISLVSNTMNSIDVMNGLLSIFIIISGAFLTVAFVFVQNYEMVLITLPLLFVALGFYKYHKFPARIFPGDSGALLFGAMYGTLAIVGNLEIVAVVAILPAVFNSFLALASMKRIVEHRQIKSKPTELTSDFKIKATSDKKAALTLVRLIVAQKPLLEKEIVHQVIKLTILSGILCIITVGIVQSEITILG